MKRKLFFAGWSILITITFTIILGPSVSNSQVPKDDKYPTAFIRIVDPNLAGGASDLLARIMAPSLSKELGAEVIVENRPGAGSQIGMSFLLSRPPDGYTIATPSEPQFAASIEIQKAPLKLEDFAWLSMNHFDCIAINVLKDKPWNTFNDFINSIRKNPGKTSIGLTQGSGPHIFMSYLKDRMKLDVTLAPYSGGAGARTALLGGHIDAMFGQTVANVPIKDQSKCIGVGAAEKSSLWPDAPTFKQLFPNDPEVSDTAISLASYRGFMVRREFKDKYPERFKKLLEALHKAYLTKEFMAAADKIQQTPILWWSGPEEGDRLSKKVHVLTAKYKHLF